MQILFVCTGNTCRSCMAEAIFNEMSDKNDVKAISAGTLIIPHSKTSKNAVKVVKDNLSIDLSYREAIQLNEKMLQKSDLVLTMTQSIKKSLLQIFPHNKDKIYTLNEYVELKDDITDPYGGDLEIYKKTFLILKKSIGLLLKKIGR